MPRKSASGKKWGSAAQRRALARATVISARKRDAAAPDHVNVQRRAVAKKIGQQSVLARKNEAFAEKERTTPKVSIEIDKAVERTKLRSGNVEKLRGELQKITPAKPAPKKRVQVKTRSAEKRPSVDGPKAPMPAGFKVGDRVTGKGRNVHEVIGPTRHPDVVKLRDTKYNVTVDALVSEIKKVPTGKPQGRRAQRTKERDAVVANAVNEPSQAEYSKKLNKAQNRISPSETKRKRTSAKKANQMPLPTANANVGPGDHVRVGRDLSKRQGSYGASVVRADALAEIRKGAIPGLDTSGVDRELNRLVPGSNVHNGTRRRSEQIESQIAARGANPHLKRTLKTAKLDELHTIARHPWAQSHPQRSEARKAAGLPDDHVVIAAPRPKKRRRKT